jgi:hypothetical protein
MRVIGNILDNLKANNRQANSEGTDNRKLQMLGFGGDQNDSYVFDQIKSMWADNGDNISK